MADNSNDGLWEKPAWAKGGMKLKKTGRADTMKTSGNLAAAITFSPFKNEDHSNKVANQGRLKNSDVGEAVKSGENLACPITHFRELAMDVDNTNYVANQGQLRQSEIGEAVKSGENLACPITHIREEVMNDNTNYEANQGVLRKSDVGNAAKAGEDLAAPVTYTPYKNTDHTNYVAHPENLRKSDVGEAAKAGEDLAMPITHIRDEMRKMNR